MDRTPLELGPFTEGVNLVDPPSKLSPSELSVCRNIRLGIRGEWDKRPGHDNYGTAPAKINGDNLVNLDLRYYKSDGTKKRISAAGGKLKFGNDATGAWTQIDIDGVAGNNMSSTNLADWMIYKDRLYITDGVRPQRYNNVDDIYAGLVIPAAPTLAQTTGGSLTLLSTYKYFTTSVQGDLGEGPAGATATITLSGANNHVNLSNILDAAAKHGQTAKRIYRTKAGGSLFYFLAEIPFGTTTYSDVKADTELGEEFVVTENPPNDARFCIMGHDERARWFGMAGVNASLVKVSDVGFPDRIISTDGFTTVANNDGDFLTGGGLSPGGVVYFKRNSMWLERAFGFGLINIDAKDKRGNGIGSTAPFSIVKTPIGLIFLSQQSEVYLFDGTNTTEIGRKIASEFKGMPDTALAKVVACYHDYRYIISYDWRGSKGYNWKTLEYDTRTGKWEGPHDNGDFYNPSYYSVWDTQADKGVLGWGESKPGNGSYVYTRTEFSKTDRGRKYVATGRSGAKPINGLVENTSFKVFVDSELSSDAKITASLIPRKGVKASVDLNVPVIASIGVWNASKWNQAKWGGKTTEVIEGSFPTGSRSRLPAFEFTDNGTASSMKLNIIELLVGSLPLK